MEFTNEIFFDKKLVQNETVLITYCGKLYKEFSSEISIVYGFGKNWDYTEEAKMQETENGFQVSITLKNYDTFNFCFKNNYNVWDNNFGFNYISAIEPAKQEQEEIKSETIVNANEQSSIENQNNKELEEAFSSLLDSILEFNNTDTTENVNLENGFGLQSVDEIEETDFTSCDDIFQELYNEIAGINSTGTGTTEEIEKSVQDIETVEEIEKISNISNEPDLETLLNNLTEKEEAKHKIINAQELDELMENILNSIIENDTKNSETENAELPTVQNDDENFIDKCIDNTYSFLRNVWNGCKKIGVLIKQKAQELLGEDK